MTPMILPEPGHVDEPKQAGDYAAVLSQVAAKGQPLIVRRNGADLAAVISLEHLELMREVLATQEAERLAGQLDFDRLVRESPPAAAWLEGEEPKPFGSGWSDRNGRRASTGEHRVGGNR
ncbi:MAG TPA: hypothetical protein VFV87_15820 [Pirellulaceae bacterium]|nr:hypothetical protein [Pirellulaceae bacterium]